MLVSSFEMSTSIFYEIYFYLMLNAVIISYQYYEILEITNKHVQYVCSKLIMISNESIRDITYHFKIIILI